MDDLLTRLRMLDEFSADAETATVAVLAADEIARLRVRVDELLTANTREVERRRVAARKVARAKTALQQIAAGASPVTASTLAVLAMYDINHMETNNGP